MKKRSQQKPPARAIMYFFIGLAICILTVLLFAGNSRQGNLAQADVTTPVTVFLHGIGKGGDNANPTSIGNQTLKHTSRTIIISTLNAQNQLIATNQGTITYNVTSQNFQGPVTITGITTGSYLMKAKVDGFLTRQFPGIQALGAGTLTLPPVYLVAGDLTNDNKLDLLDYNALINCFASKFQTCNTPLADVNDDGKVDGVDYNLLIRELSVQAGDTTTNPTGTPITQPISPIPTSAGLSPTLSPSFTYDDPPTTMYTDNDAGLISGGTGTPVSAPATVDFGAVKIDANKYSTEYGMWANDVLGPDGKYYYGLGDHDTASGGHNGSILMSYDPKTKRSEMLLFAKDVIGPAGEGKWHGRPDIDPLTGDMYLVGFYQGHIIHYNIYSRQAKDLGAPVNAGWPEHAWDYKRQRLYGVGDGKGGFMVYDTANKKLLHSDPPKDSKTGTTITWADRARFIDYTTGKVYGTTGDNHIVNYDPNTDTFTIMNSQMSSAFRAMSLLKEPEGFIWSFDSAGNIYKFYPEQDTIQKVGVTWTSALYSAAIAESPDHKYLYYSMSNDSSDLPIIQYNTKTGEKKALIYVKYENKHNFAANKIYGVTLNADGTELFAVTNGSLSGTRYPAVIYIHIPPEDRP